MQSNIISNQDLPESFFRKAICVVTILGLVIANLYIMLNQRGLLYIITVAVIHFYIYFIFIEKKMLKNLLF